MSDSLLVEELPVGQVETASTAITKNRMPSLTETQLSAETERS